MATICRQLQLHQGLMWGCEWFCYSPAETHSLSSSLAKAFHPCQCRSVAATNEQQPQPSPPPPPQPVIMMHRSAGKKESLVGDQPLTRQESTAHPLTVYHPTLCLHPPPSGKYLKFVCQRAHYTCKCIPWCNLHLSVCLSEVLLPFIQLKWPSSHGIVSWNDKATR